MTSRCCWYLFLFSCLIKIYEIPLYNQENERKNYSHPWIENWLDIIAFLRSGILLECIGYE